MKKFIIAGIVGASFLVPAVASADQPDGDYMGSLKDGVSLVEWGGQRSLNENASIVGEYSSRSTQNGQFIGNGDNGSTATQTATPGSRGALVQQYHASEGKGSLAK
jgi:hypothetical protein